MLYLAGMGGLLLAQPRPQNTGNYDQWALCLHQGEYDPTTAAFAVVLVIGLPFQAAWEKVQEAQLQGKATLTFCNREHGEHYLTQLEAKALPVTLEKV